MKNSIILLAVLMPVASFAQNYNIDWYKISSGGGTSTGATYQLSGTIGQPDASVAMIGGSYSITGGFWSLISVVQTAGLPNLTITHSGTSAIVSWPNTGSYTLQQNANLAVSAEWVTSAYSITASNGISSISISLASGSLFFRLK